MKHRIEEELPHRNLQHEESTGRSRLGLYFALYLLYAAGMLGTVLATNLIQFYIFFELMLVPSYFLIAQFGYGNRNRIGFMYFLWTHLGALVLLAGILTAGLLAGGLDYATLATNGVPGFAAGFVGVLVAVGLFVKLAAFGLHIWLPYAHAEAPTPISALLSPAMIGIGGYALIRLLVFLLPASYAAISLGIAVWGLITMFYGGVMALTQDDLKRLLAYSSVSQMGYLIFGAASADSLGITGGVFQYVSHGTGKAILFMVAGAIILQARGLRSISRMGGLSRMMPTTAVGAMIGFLVIVGVPPLNGFQSEWMLFAGALARAVADGSAARLALAVLALAATPLTAGYTLWAMKRIFFGRLPEHLFGVREAPLSVLGPILFLAVLSIVLGIYPAPIVDRLIPAVRSVFGG
jgi:NADH-quinone oxidoreductase subunit M